MKVIHLVSNRVWGGGERYVLDLASTQKESGIDVMILTRGFGQVDAPMAAAGMQIGHLPLRGELDFISPLRLARTMLKGDERQIIVHAHNFKDAIIAVRARRIARLMPESAGKEIRIVCTRHLAKRGKTGFMSHELYNGLDAIIFISQLAKNEFLASKPDVDARKIHVIHNSIIPTSEKSQTEVAGIPDEVTLLYIGRISPEKGLENLLKSISYLKHLPLRLLICGSGDEKYVSELKRICAALQIERSVCWLGHQSDVYDYIRKCDIGIVPTKVREAFGLVLLEFMSQGVPVITTDNGAQPEIVRDGCEGRLVAPERPHALAEAIEELASDSRLRKEMGQNAFRRFESTFSYSNFYSNITNLYNSLLP